MKNLDTRLKFEFKLSSAVAGYVYCLMFFGILIRYPQPWYIYLIGALLYGLKIELVRDDDDLEDC